MSSEPITFNPDGLYTPGCLAETLGDGVDVKRFIRKIKPVKRFKQFYLGSDLINAIRRTEPLPTSMPAPSMPVTSGLTVHAWLEGPGRNACKEGHDYLMAMPSGTTASETWGLCEVPEWMLWAVRHSGIRISGEVYRRLACEIVKRVKVSGNITVLEMAESCDSRYRAVLEAAETGSNEVMAKARAEVRIGATKAGMDTKSRACLRAVRATAKTSPAEAVDDVIFNAVWAARGARLKDSARAEMATIMREIIENPWAGGEAA